MDGEKSKNYKQYRIYRANKNGDGAASTFQFAIKKDAKGYDRVLMFLVSAKQGIDDSNGNATFAWENPDLSTTVQLDELDVADMLLVLQGRKPGLGFMKDGKPGSIYHENKRGNASIRLDASERGYNLNVSVKRDNQLIKVGHGIDFREGVILERLLNDFLSAKYSWQV